MPEIDYDRLAEAIVKANLKSQRIKQESQTAGQKRHTFFRTFVMKIMNFAIYAAILLLIIAAIYMLWSHVVPRRIFSERTAYAMTAALVIVALFAFLCLIEGLLDQNDDIRIYFSINMSLISLMLSMINFVSKFI